MVADECGEYLHHGRVVFCGITGNPLEGVDAADAHVELFGSELLDGLGIAVSYLPFAGQVEVPRREDQGPGGEQARASVRSRPRAASRAVCSSAGLAGPTSWRASQSASGTNKAHTIAAVSTTAAIPASHRMPCGQAAQRFNIRKR